MTYEQIKEIKKYAREVSNPKFGKSGCFMSASDEHEFNYALKQLKEAINEAETVAS